MLINFNIHLIILAELAHLAGVLFVSASISEMEKHLSS